MTPYGIVYKENPFAFEKSLEFWQKKFGILKFSSLLRVDLIFIFVIAVMSAVLSVILKDTEEFDISLCVYSAVILSLITCVFSYVMAKNSFVKQPARMINTRKKKQIVLYEDKIKFGSENSIAEYSYDDIILCYEKFNILTIVMDEGALPFSVSKNAVEKGDYDVFSSILKEKLSFRYIRKEGKNI